jgi:hypothetical protein
MGQPSDAERNAGLDLRAARRNNVGKAVVLGEYTDSLTPSVMGIGEREQTEKSNAVVMMPGNMTAKYFAGEHIAGARVAAPDTAGKPVEVRNVMICLMEVVYSAEGFGVSKYTGWLVHLASIPEPGDEVEDESVRFLA